MLGLTAVCSYGFLITHQTVGIDDTPYAYYFEEGLNAIVGRWFLFLLNKVFHVSEFSPFLTDFAGVLILMAAVTVWCALLHSVCGGKVPVWGYVFFSCIFLSSPLLGEVYTYYLHNGVSVGYLCTGISLCFWKELAEAGKMRRKALEAGLGAAVFLMAALGCYESFMIVWLLGIFLVLLTERYLGVRCRVISSLLGGALSAVAAVVMRSVVIAGVIGIFGLGDMRGEAVQRSVLEMAGWMFEAGASAEFAMAVKRIYVMYGVFAYAYYPIRVFVMASVFMVLFGGYRAVRQRDGWIAALTAGSFAVSFLLVIVEGKATLYRSAQFLTVLCGYGAFLAAYAVSGLKDCRIFGGSRSRGNGVPDGGAPEDCRIFGESQGKSVPDGGAPEDCRIFGESQGKSVPDGGAPEDCRILEGSRGKGVSGGGAPGDFRLIGRGRKAYGVCRGLAVFGLCAVLWNQCFDMNRWFYVDWMKYESAVDVAGQIAWELERGYDTDKPVVFTGAYQPPRGIIGDAYVGYGTETFFRMKRLTDVVDEHLLEKFYRDYGVWVAQTPALSVLDWGMNAFNNDVELERFFAMHGYRITANRDMERYEAAQLYSAQLPHFPAEGSIVDMGDYIIVHF